MTHFENIFVCLAAPMLLGMLCVQRRHRAAFAFAVTGMAACLLSAYVNTFFAAVYGADLITATTEIAPAVEESMKLLPLLFYLILFEPPMKQVRLAVLVLAISFATFENICYMVQNGADSLTYLLLRGFGTGAMHVVCGSVFGYGFAYIWERAWLKLPGTLGLLCASITFHAVYNLLLSGGGAVQIVGYVMPIVTLTAARILTYAVKQRKALTDA